MIEVRLTPDMGRGVFVTQDVSAGTVLGEFHTLQCSATVPPLSDYAFVGDDGSACLVFGWLSLVNHGMPNIEKRWIMTELGEIAVAVAARDIVAGEQLFHDYGFAEGEAPAWAA